MSREARKAHSLASAEVVKKIAELAELISRERFGEQGVPKEITFSEIEQIGHDAGRLLAAQVDHRLVAEHGHHFAGEQACPQCGQACASETGNRELTTRDGPVRVHEAMCHCDACRRSFFPSACALEAGWASL